VGDAHDATRVATVLATSARSRTPGYEFIVAAPRAVSVLLALEARADLVVAAHRSAVGSVIDYLEDHALAMRFRGGGENVQTRTHFGDVVAFTHGINRAGEPHLHDHVLVGAQPPGEPHTLDARGLFVHQPVASAIYRARLRFELNRDGLAIWRSRAGVDHVDGLDEGWRALWSGRADERGPKIHWHESSARAKWHADMVHFEALGAITPRTRDTLDAVRYDVAGLRTVRRRHLVRALANAATRGTTLAQIDEVMARDFEELDHGFALDEARTPGEWVVTRTRALARPTGLIRASESAHPRARA
jgi:hypothetical protein